jgi:hypothetical protein
MDIGDNGEYRRLIEALMHLGWYRQGEVHRPPDDKLCWAFRSGHTLEDPTSSRRYITARNEVTAMRSLLRELQRPVANNAID